MLGICPNCKIRLKEPPFNDRDTNEVMLVIRYRDLIESGNSLKPIEELGFCELCKAKISDIDSQNRMCAEIKIK